MSSNNTAFEGDSIGDNISGAVILHGLCMFLSFAVLPVVSVFSVRYLLKKRYWLWLHIGMNILSVILMCIGLWLIEYAVSTPFALRSVHGTMGTFLTLLLLPLQLIAGLYTAFNWDTARTRSPGHVKFHRWTGRLLLIVTTAEIQLGIVQAGLSPPVSAGLWSWLLTVVSLFLVMGKKPINHREMPPLPSDPQSSHSVTGKQSIMQRLDGFKAHFSVQRKQLQSNGGTNSPSSNYSLTRPSSKTGGFSDEYTASTYGRSDASSPNESIPMRTMPPATLGNRFVGAKKPGYPAVSNMKFDSVNSTLSSSPNPSSNSEGTPFVQVRNAEAMDYDFVQSPQNNNNNILESERNSNLPPRRLFSEPDQVSLHSRNSHEFPSSAQQPRVVYSEPDEISVLRHSTTLNSPAVQRIIYSEPDDVVSLSRQGTAVGPNRAVNRVFFEEPEEL